jgi:sulfite exporter TauE/SafE
MMPHDVGSLYFAAASIGLIHTLLGPDHYLPFVALARAGRWSFPRTLVITLTCGAAHVLSSVALGAAGLGLGVAVFHLEAIEGFRGHLAGWMLLAFGLVYFIWGVTRAVRNRPHSHLHIHADGEVHTHRHVHAGNHAHVHLAGASPEGRTEAGLPRGALIPWTLFLVFIFGPCEPLIPILMYPAAQGNWLHAVGVSAVFGAATLLTMAAIVFVSCSGLRLLPPAPLHRYDHALCGLTLVVCGVAVVFGL